MPPFIAHLDADCFYVSCERVRHGGLRRVPVGVLGNHGACVIAKSYEMKAAGVKTGMPIWDARPLCPLGVYVQRDFAWYEVLSRRMLDLVKKSSPRVEYYSIDEMFFIVERPLLSDAKELQHAMLGNVGVALLAGVLARAPKQSQRSQSIFHWYSRRA